jgi:protein involved in polysaccharide export with SLBB domain
MIFAAKEDAMLRPRFPKLRFGMKTVLVLFCGIAIGFSLNLHTWKLLTGRSMYSQLPEYVIEPPDVLEISVTGGNSENPTSTTSKYLVRPDGRINLNELGTIYVAGMTVGEAHTRVERVVAKKLSSPCVKLDVSAYNSKKYYIIFSGPGSSGDYVEELPITGNETVLDAIAAMRSIPFTGPIRMSVSRQPVDGIGPPSTLHVDWDQIASGRSTATNYRLQPQDRLIISQLTVPAANP